MNVLISMNNMHRTLMLRHLQEDLLEGKTGKLLAEVFATNPSELDVCKEKMQAFQSVLYLNLIAAVQIASKLVSSKTYIRVGAATRFLRYCTSA